MSRTNKKNVDSCRVSISRCNTKVVLPLLMWVGSCVFVSALSSSHPTTTTTHGTSSSFSSPTEEDDDDHLSLFSGNEIKEMNHVWDIIRSTCAGCWSGTIDIYDFDCDTGSIHRHREQVGRTNFRLQVKIEGGAEDENDKGTWTVWNLQSKGDETVIPLRRIPSSRPTQVKIGFDSGIILRIPRVWTEGPRVVFEIGFWDKQQQKVTEDDNMRRTAVFEYKKISPSALPFWSRIRRMLSFLRRNRKKTDKSQLVLKDIAVVQQKKWEKDVNKFVGNSTDPDAIHVLPANAPFHISDLNLKEELIPLSCETVNLRSMERTYNYNTNVGHTSSSKSKNNNKEMGCGSSNSVTVLDTLIGQTRQRRMKNYLTQVLPCGMCIAVPPKLIPGASFQCIFAHEWKSGSFQAVQVEYDSETNEAVRVTLHTYRRTIRRQAMQQ